MYESNTTAKTLVDAVKAEIEASAPFDDEWYAALINETEQMIYSRLTEFREAVKLNRRDFTHGNFDDDLLYVPLSAIGANRAEDILNIMVDGLHELTLMPYEKMYLPRAYCIRSGGYIGIQPGAAREIRVVFRVRPLLKTADNLETETVKLPPEYIGVIKEKLLGEAYASIGAYAESGFHFDEYNNKLQALSEYIKTTNTTYGKVG